MTKTPPWLTRQTLREQQRKLLTPCTHIHGPPWLTRQTLREQQRKPLTPCTHIHGPPWLTRQTPREQQRKLLTPCTHIHGPPWLTRQTPREQQRKPLTPCGHTYTAVLVPWHFNPYNQSFNPYFRPYNLISNKWEKVTENLAQADTQRFLQTQEPGQELCTKTDRQTHKDRQTELLTRSSAVTGCPLRLVATTIRPSLSLMSTRLVVNASTAIISLATVISNWHYIHTDRERCE